MLLNNLMSIFNNQKVIAKCLQPLIRRSIGLRAPMGRPRGYDGDGKTTLHVLNKDEGLGLMIDGYSQVGFKLSNNMTVLGPMVIFSRSVLSWNIGDVDDINEDSLSLLKVLVPKIDIIVLGTGNKTDNRDLFKTFWKFSREYRISFEILPTDTACPTFNFLNVEGRNVIGAMLPPQHVRGTEDDQLRSGLRYDKVFQQTHLN